MSQGTRQRSDYDPHPCIDCGKVVKLRTSIRCKGCSRKHAFRQAYTPRFCKQCKGEIPTTCGNRLRAIYCSKACKFADPDLRAKLGPPLSGERVAKSCPACKIDFEVLAATAHRYNYCSRRCSSTRGVDVTCERCGKQFRRSQTEVRRHCSEVCRRPPATISCLYCDEEVRVPPSVQSTQRYCSFGCYRASGAETTIELIVRGRLEQTGLAFESQAKVGRWSVDFLIGGRIAVEADGDYWHALRPDADARKTAALIKRGLTVWRLAESEIIASGFEQRLRTRLDAFEAFAGALPHADLFQSLNPARTQTRGATRMARPGTGWPKGEAVHNAKLRDEQILEIRSSTGSVREAADRFGVGASTIYKIRRGEVWRHLGGPVAEARKRRPGLTDEQKAAVRASNERNCDLARFFGVTPQQICQARRGHLWSKPR